MVGSASVLVSQAATNKLVYLTGPQTFITGTGATAGSGAISVQLQDSFGNPIVETAKTGLTFTTGLSGVTYIAVARLDDGVHGHHLLHRGWFVDRHLLHDRYLRRIRRDHDDGGFLQHAVTD